MGNQMSVPRRAEDQENDPEADTHKVVSLRPLRHQLLVGRGGVTAEGGACPRLVGVSGAAVAAAGGCSVGRKPPEPIEELLKVQAPRGLTQGPGNQKSQGRGPLEPESPW